MAAGNDAARSRHGARRWGPLTLVAGAALLLAGAGGALATRHARLARLQAELPLKPLPVQAGAGGSHALTLAVVTPHSFRCSGGDLEVMSMDLMNRGIGADADPSRPATQRALLVTVERLDAAGDKPLASAELDSVAMFRLADAQRVHWKNAVQLPAGRQAGLYGIFICSADKAGDSCLDKHVIDPNRILQTFAESRTPDADVATRDKVYFFQPLLAAATGVQTLKSPKQTLQVWDDLTDLTLGYLPFYGTKARRTAVDYARGTMTTLLSMPLEAKDGVVRIELPRIAPECYRDLDFRLPDGSVPVPGK